MYMSHTVKLEKIKPGYYTIMLDGKNVGTAEKCRNMWVVNGRNGERSGCFGKTCKQVVGKYLDIITG
jgi:hypothetical protein